MNEVWWRYGLWRYGTGRVGVWWRTGPWSYGGGVVEIRRRYFRGMMEIWTMEVWWRHNGDMKEVWWRCGGAMDRGGLAEVWWRHHLPPYQHEAHQCEVFLSSGNVPVGSLKSCGNFALGFRAHEAPLRRVHVINTAARPQLKAHFLRPQMSFVYKHCKKIK